MKTNILTELGQQLSNYISHLDWAYILTFIIIAYGMNNAKIAQKLYEITKLKLKTRYRTAFVGGVYGVGIYFMRGYSLAEIEMLFQSFVFAMVFHKLVVDGVLKYLGTAITPKITPPEEEDYYRRFKSPSKNGIKKD